MSTADSVKLAIAIALALSVIVSLGVAIVTYKAVLANRAAVEVLRAQLEATIRPYILVVPIVRASRRMPPHIANASAAPSLARIDYKETRPHMPLKYATPEELGR